MYMFYGRHLLKIWLERSAAIHSDTESVQPLNFTFGAKTIDSLLQENHSAWRKNNFCSRSSDLFIPCFRQRQSYFNLWAFCELTEVNARFSRVTNTSLLDIHLKHNNNIASISVLNSVMNIHKYSVVAFWFNIRARISLSVHGHI